MDPKLLKTIAEKLDVDAGLVVRIEYPGYLAIPHATQAGLTWAFGTANGTWQGDLTLENTGTYHGETLETGINASETDAGVIALAIARVLLSSHYSEVETCPFCHSLDHTDVRDCPEIDTKQLREELPHLRPRACENCGEEHRDAIHRDYGMRHCDRCHEAQLDYGFMHCPDAFECEVCGEFRRSATAENGMRCAECRASHIFYRGFTLTPSADRKWILETPSSYAIEDNVYRLLRYIAEV